MKHRIALVLSLALITGTAIAQPANPRNPAGRAGLRNNIPRPTNIPFESIYKKNESGEVQAVQGHYDLFALKHNPTVSDETLKKVTPALQDWMAEVDRLAIDNLDFIEELKGGLIDKVKLQDAAELRKVSEMMQQLMAAGSAARYLNELGLLDQQQAGVNQQIINDYQQALMNQVRPANVNQQQLPKEQQEEMASKVSRLLYRMSSNDTFVAHDRLLLATAPKINEVLGAATLSPEGKAKTNAVASSVAAISASADDATKAGEVSKALQSLSFSDRQAVLRKVAELRGPIDPWAGTPARPANIPANAPGASAAAPAQPEKR